MYKLDIPCSSYFELSTSSMICSASNVVLPQPLKLAVSSGYISNLGSSALYIYTYITSLFIRRNFLCMVALPSVGRGGSIRSADARFVPLSSLTVSLYRRIDLVDAGGLRWQPFNSPTTINLKRQTRRIDAANQRCLLQCLRFYY